MDHRDHVSLLKDGIPVRGGIWADFGSGAGAFTLALAELIGPQGKIYSIDIKRTSLSSQEDAFRRHFKGTITPMPTFINADFTCPIELPALDGLVMANSLHFHKDQQSVVRLAYGYLKPSGRMLLVEYNLNRSNPWVPYPVNYSAWDKLAAVVGFRVTRMLKRRPSRTMKEIYSALSIK